MKEEEGLSFFLPEDDALQVEGVLYDSRRGDAHPEHILLGGEIAGVCNAIQIGKITTDRPLEGRRRRKDEERKKKKQKNSYISAHCIDYFKPQVRSASLTTGI